MGEAKQMIELDTSRVGDWMQTFCQIKFYPQDPRPEEIDIIDIAHALSQIPRFTGHGDIFYSVAQHSLYVMQMCPPPFKLEGLLHDASEAYLGDMGRPLKHFSELGKIYKQLENKVNLAIAQKFRLKYPWPEPVKRADNTILGCYEHGEVMPIVKGIEWGVLDDRLIPTSQRLGITELNWREVEKIFFDTFIKLNGGKR